MLHTEGGARQNCVAAERRGEAAIASDCIADMFAISLTATILMLRMVSSPSLTRLVSKEKA
jgi:hypothetical protein